MFKRNLGIIYKTVIPNKVLVCGGSCHTPVFFFFFFCMYNEIMLQNFHAVFTEVLTYLHGCQELALMLTYTMIRESMELPI